jgi:hypothetical protein
VVKGGVHRRDLLDLAHEPRERGGEGGRVQRGHGPLAQHRSGGVLRVRGHAEPRRRHVFLVERGEIGRELGPLAHEDGQEPGGVGIERAAVADLGRAEQAPELRHHLE